jgi:hypothetical protein
LVGLVDFGGISKGNKKKKKKEDFLEQCHLSEYQFKPNQKT